MGRTGAHCNGGAQHQPPGRRGLLIVRPALGQNEHSGVGRPGGRLVISGSADAYVNGQTNNLDKQMSAALVLILGIFGGVLAAYGRRSTAPVPVHICTGRNRNPVRRV